MPRKMNEGELTQRQIAKLFGVSTQTIGDWLQREILASQYEKDVYDLLRRSQMRVVFIPPTAGTRPCQRVRRGRPAYDLMDSEEL